MWILIFALFVDAVGFYYGSLLLYRGIKFGIIDKHILSKYSGTHVEGRDALALGIFYTFFGLFFLIGAIITLFVILAKVL